MNAIILQILISQKIILQRNKELILTHHHKVDQIIILSLVCRKLGVKNLQFYMTTVGSSTSIKLALLR